MKQLVASYAGVAGQNMMRDLSIYVQAFWHLGSRYVARNLGVAGRGRKPRQARYESQPNTLPTVLAKAKRASAAPCNKQKVRPLPNGALTEIRSFSGINESQRVAAQTASAQGVKELPLKSFRQLSVNKWQQELGQMLPALAGFCQQRWLVLLAPPCVPSAEELIAAGIDPARVLMVHSSNANGFTALQQALRSGTCGAVLAWLENSDEKPMEELRQAAEAGNAWGVLFRVPKRNQGAQLEMSIA